VSFKRGEPGADKLEAQWRSGARVRVHEHADFEVLEDRKKLVRAYLNQFLKELDEEHLQALTRCAGSGQSAVSPRGAERAARVRCLWRPRPQDPRLTLATRPCPRSTLSCNASRAIPTRRSRPASNRAHPVRPARTLAGRPAETSAPGHAVEELGASAELHPAGRGHGGDLPEAGPALPRATGGARGLLLTPAFCAAAQERYARADAPLPMRTTAAWPQVHRALVRAMAWDRGCGKELRAGALVHHSAARQILQRDAMTDFGSLRAVGEARGGRCHRRSRGTLRR